MRNVTWLLAIVLGACSHTHGPQDSTQTGNPPLLEPRLKEALLTLEVSAGEVHITGAPGAVTPGGAKVEITNLTTGDVIEGTAEADGSFDLRVDGSMDDAFAVRAVADDESSPPVYVVRGGAAIEGGDDGSLSCDEYHELVAAVLASSAATADRRCQSDNDCVATLKTASCFNDCEYAYVTSEGASQIETTGSVLDEGLCADYSENGCVIALPRCGAGGDSLCIDGMCVDPGAALSCEEGSRRARARIAEVAATADRQCERHSDCMGIGFDVECNYGCDGAVVSSTGKAQIEAAMDEVNAGVCADVLADGCKYSAPSCPLVAFTVARCEMGQCKPVPVNSSTRLPACMECFTETLRWGPNGGLPAYVDQSELASCARYAHRRLSATDPTDEQLGCEQDLWACNSVASTAAVKSALTDAEVQQAFADSPIVYGIDARGVDGQVFEIALGPKVIDVGGPCGAASAGCVEIPTGVQQLVDLLVAIDQQMLMAPECAGFQDE